MDSTKNKYDYLRIAGTPGIDIPVAVSSSWMLTDSRREAIIITNTIMTDGSWVYGYVVYRANGRISAMAPSAEFGQFNTQREAKLHAVGFFLSHLSHFLPETQVALRRAEASLIKTSLF